MAWQYPPSTWIAIVNTLLLVLLAYLSWRRRSYYAARLYLYILIFLLIAKLISVVQSLSAEPWLIIFLERLSWVPWLMVSVLALMFAKTYIGQEEWVTRRRFVVLTSIAAAFAVIILTDGFHHLYYISLDVATEDGLLVVRTIYNTQSPVLWLGRIFPFGLGFYFLLLVLTELRRPHALYRQRAMLLLISGLLTIVLTYVDFTSDGDVRRSDLFYLSINLPVLPIVLSFYRFRFLDLTPIANDVVIRDLVDAVFVLDTHHSIVGLNPAAERLLGEPERALVGKAIDAILPTEWYVCLRKAIDTQEHSALVVKRATATIHYDISTSPLSDSRGNPLGFVAVFRDVTALKQTEERAISLAVEKERNQLIQVMLHDVAHDLRTPLTELELSAHLLQRSAHAAEQDVAQLRAGTASAQHDGALENLNNFVVRVDERAVQTNQNAARLRTIFDTMFDFVRVNGEQEIELQPMDLNQLVRETCDTMEARAEAKHISIHLALDDDLPLAHLHRDQFARAIRNLIENGIRYSSTGGEIRLQTSLQGDQICLTIADQGIGISAKDMSRIFETFYRADKARQPDSGGIGLGLAMARRIVRAHGGTIEVDSTPDVGTCFCILLPAERQPALP